MKLANLKIGQRLMFIVFAGIAGAIIVAAVELSEIRSNLFSAHEDQVASLVDSVHTMLDHYEGEAQSGAMSKEDAQAAAKAAVGAMRYEKTEYFFILDSKGVMVMHPVSAKLIGKDQRGLKDKAGKPFINELLDVVKGSAAGGYVEYMWPKAGSEVPVPKLSYAKMYEPWGWVVVSGVYIDNIDTIYRENMMFTIGLVLVVLLLIGTASFFISRAITRPLGVVTRSMLRLADGDRDIHVGDTDSKSEIGDLTRALKVFHGKMTDMERMREEQEALKRAADQERRRAALALADDFERSVLGVVETVSSSATEMRSNADSLSEMSTAVSQRSATVSAATEQASMNVQTVATATEELTASIGEISRQVSQAAGITGTAVEAIEASNRKVQGLAVAVNKIGEVVNLITDIADQTNLLALNATIEAARAGDAGKGFAVVASEVKNLANQTAKATEEIGAQIAAVQGATKEAVEAIRNIGVIIGEISEATSTIASAVEEQSAATQEISRNVAQAAAGTEEVATNVVEVNASASEAGQASQSVLEAATSLMGDAEKLRRDVDNFLGQIRSDAKAAA